MWVVAAVVLEGVLIRWQPYRARLQLASEAISCSDTSAPLGHGLGT